MEFDSSSNLPWSRTLCHPKWGVASIMSVFLSLWATKTRKSLNTAPQCWRMTAINKLIWNNHHAPSCRLKHLVGQINCLLVCSVYHSSLFFANNVSCFFDFHATVVSNKNTGSNHTTSPARTVAWTLLAWLDTKFKTLKIKTPVLDDLFQSFMESPCVMVLGWWPTVLLFGLLNLVKFILSLRIETICGCYYVGFSWSQSCLGFLFPLTVPMFFFMFHPCLPMFVYPGVVLACPCLSHGVRATSCFVSP